MTIVVIGALRVKSEGSQYIGNKHRPCIQARTVLLATSNRTFKVYTLLIEKKL